MELQAVTGQLYIVNGVTQESAAAPGLLAGPAPGKAVHGRARDFLFVHLSLSGQPEESAELAKELLALVSNDFYQTPGSVTAALRKAILAANEHLLRHNLRSNNQKREGALTCAVLRGEELFMAQAGEGFALLGLNFGVERLPANEPARVTPLGRTAGLDVRYFHHRLLPGSLLLLADPRMAHLPAATLSLALSNGHMESGLEKLEEMIGSGTARLILVEFTDEAPDYIPEATRPTSVLQKVTRPMAILPRREPKTKPTPPAEDEFEEGRDAPLTERPTQALPPVDGSRVEDTARRATAHTALSLSRAAAWLADVLRELRPPRPTEAEPDPVGWALPAFLAIIIPILIAAIVTSVYFQRGQVVQYGQIKQQIQQSQGLAEQAGDDATARGYYDQVIALAATAQTMRPDDSDVELIRQQAQAEIDRIDGVTRLQAQPLYTYQEGVRLTGVTLREGLNGDIYTLDVTHNQVYSHDTDESYLVITTQEPEVVLFGQQVVGSYVVTGIVDMMWRPRGSNVSRDGLAMLDSLGGLITFYPNFEDTRAVPLGLASDWERPSAIATFDERLYVLDPGVGAIWRYLPQGDGFILDNDQPALTFDENADLDQVADVAIYSEDGSVLLLYGDGRLRRYANGRLLWGEVDLAQNGLQVSLVAPVALKIVGQGLNSSIFVADPPTGRIVQFALGGTFLAQYKATTADKQELFMSTADFAVAESPLRIFTVGNNQLYAATQE
jgi:hypothetical protein